MNKAMLMKAARVALVVGTVLLLINQFDALFGDQTIKWLPALLTYCVPFVVFISGQLSSQKECLQKEHSQEKRRQEELSQAKAEKASLVKS